MSAADYDSDQESVQSSNSKTKTTKRSNNNRPKKRDKPREETHDQKVMKLINRVTSCGDLPISKFMRKF